MKNASKTPRWEDPPKKKPVPQTLAQALGVPESDLENYIAMQAHSEAGHMGGIGEAIQRLPLQLREAAYAQVRNILLRK